MRSGPEGRRADVRRSSHDSFFAGEKMKGVPAVVDSLASFLVGGGCCFRIRRCFKQPDRRFETHCGPTPSLFIIHFEQAGVLGELGGQISPSAKRTNSTPHPPHSHEVVESCAAPAPCPFGAFKRRSKMQEIRDEPWHMRQGPACVFAPPFRRSDTSWHPFSWSSYQRAPSS